MYLSFGIKITFLFSFQSLMNTNKEEMRELAAQLYAVVVSTMTGNELQTAVQTLVKITRDNHVRHFAFCLDFF